MQLNCGYDPIVGADHVRDSALANKEALPGAPACHDPELAVQGRLIAGMARLYGPTRCCKPFLASTEVRFARLYPALESALCRSHYEMCCHCPDLIHGLDGQSGQAGFNDSI